MLTKRMAGPLRHRTELSAMLSVMVYAGSYGDVYDLSGY